MKVIIDITKEDLKKDVIDVKRCLTIPDNATRGNVLKLLFPNIQIREEENSNFLTFTFDGIVGSTVEKDWWYSPYEENE